MSGRKKNVIDLFVGIGVGFLSIGILTNPSVGAELPGVSQFSYKKNGIEVTVGLDDILKITDPDPADGLEPETKVTFSEKNEPETGIGQFNLSIAGGDFDSDSSQTFAFTGAFWDITLSVSQNAGFIKDILSASGSAAHTKGPHLDDGIGKPVNFAFTLDAKEGLESIIQPPLGITKHDTNGHIDDYDGTLSGTILTTSILSDITSWNFNLNATHKVPEPLTILGSGLALGFGAYFKKQYSQKQKKAKAKA